MSSRYAAVHKLTHGPGDARPTALDIVKDEGLEGKLSDKVFLITGCSSGIGIETARALSATGAKLFLGVRDTVKGESALSDILEPGRVEMLQIDLNSLESVRAAVQAFLQKSKTLNILINNAGVMATPKGRTADGFETQLGTNHLAHFLLFQLLKPALLASSTPDFNSRVIALSSSGHRMAGIQFDNYNFEKSDSYSPWIAYGQSKTANIYMANEIERRYGAKGLHALSLHPGGIFTGLQIHISDALREKWTTDEVRQHMKSPAQGAATTIYAALGKEWEGRGGRYLEDCAESPPVPTEGYTQFSKGYAPHAFDEESEKRLWIDSLSMVGLEDDK